MDEGAPPGSQVSPRWAAWRASIPLDQYVERFERNARSGEHVHGEADLIDRYLGQVPIRSILDAGCGTGRVAIELAARGHDVVGVDLDDDMIDAARRLGPGVPFETADLACLALGRRFGIVAMAGNVMIFCRPTDRASIVASVAGHLESGGLLIAGFEVEASTDALTVTEYDRVCADAGLTLFERFSTWDGDHFRGGRYAVSIHRGPVEYTDDPPGTREVG